MATKKALKIALLAAALIVTGGCSARQRAERRVRRAVALCPDMVQVKAHPIEGTATAPAFADVAHVPLRPVMDGDTLYAATEHGTVAVSLRRADGALRVGFVAAPREVRYTDTLYYSQVQPVAPKPAATPRRGGGVAWALLGAVVAFGTGMALCFRLHRKR